MSKYIYPAIFKQEGEYFNVSFPDLPGCNTFGKGLMESYDMAEDALALYLYTLEERNEEIPVPCDIASLSMDEGAFASLVSCDTITYRERYDSKLVNKTVTLENWLNKLAEKNHLNCSRLLRNAIKTELGIER